MAEACGGRKFRQQTPPQPRKAGVVRAPFVNYVYHAAHGMLLGVDRRCTPLDVKARPFRTHLTRRSSCY